MSVATDYLSVGKFSRFEEGQNDRMTECQNDPVGMWRRVRWCTVMLVSLAG